ncbi:DMT family transporter [Enterovibrio sp. ZSDZ42]|uniref:DMT family transporter n=1 Tax=Enterovibrio gelatinilyticus TaxID=2899819 RepID=A0ABT5R6D9_9GAMM|nr:DMT family transporter [Enterovibrio sp. ZSDZ42]MDD1795847.1 DMT family transporter [Enterovibrio sp. ZSDZ42]
MGYEWLALAAAFLWGISSLISVTPARHLGSFAYSRWRMASVSIMLSLLALFTGGWATVTSDIWWPMAVSGLIGIFIGDTALFGCMNRIGPRRSGLLYSCHAGFSALLGIWLFGETLQGIRLVGAILVFSGVMIAVFFRQSGNAHQWEETKGSLGVAIALGLTAALCQSLGGVIAKPVLTGNVDPIAASAIRMIAAFAAHGILVLLQVRVAQPVNPINWRIFGMVVVNGFLAMAVGMTLIMYALKWGEVGMVALLSSTTPVMVLPLIWLFTKVRPSPSAWIGAALAVTGAGLIVSS